MDEAESLERLKGRDEAALVWLMERYAPYVNTVVYNIIGSAASHWDVEEVSSDVFLILWQNAGAVREGKVKAYLGAVARNKAREKLRSLGGELPLGEDGKIFNLQYVYEKGSEPLEQYRLAEGYYEYYTTRDGVQAAIQIETTHTGKSFFWVNVSVGETRFSMGGTQMELEEIHAILDRLGLSGLSGS